MTNKLKVYGILTFMGEGNQVRSVAAVTSQKQFASLIGSSLHYVRDYAAETGNEEERKVAFKHIGRLVKH